MNRRHNRHTEVEPIIFGFLLFLRIAKKKVDVGWKLFQTDQSRIANCSPIKHHVIMVYLRLRAKLAVALYVREYWELGSKSVLFDALNKWPSVQPSLRQKWTRSVQAQDFLYKSGLSSCKPSQPMPWLNRCWCSNCKHCISFHASSPWISFRFWPNPSYARPCSPFTSSSKGEHSHRWQNKVI